VDGLGVRETTPVSAQQHQPLCVACAACSATAPQPTAAVIGFREAHIFRGEPTLSEIAAVPLPRRAFCCDWVSDGRVLLGCDSGSVLVLSSCDAAATIAVAADLRPDPIGTHSSSSSNHPVRSVAACPYDTSAFATVEGEAFRVWAVDATAADARPVLTRKPLQQYQHQQAGATLHRFAWSPHNEAIAAISAALHMLAFIDIRLDRPVVARKDAAHSRRLSALAWSPYVPYWLATGGQDACVKIWDLRNAARPALCLEHCVGTINSIAWDTRHPELLAVGSNDAGLSCCSLELRPDYLLWSHSARSAVVAAGFAPTCKSQSCCFGVSDAGSVIVATMADSFFLPLIAERKVFSDTSSRDVAQQVYLRQFRKAFSAAYQLALSLEAQKKPEEALAVLNLCYQREVQTAVDFTALNTQAPSEELFSQDVAGIAIQVPPGYHERFATEIDPSLSVDIEQLKLVLELQIMLQKKQTNAIMARHKDICDSLRKDRTRIDVALLYQIVRAELETDYIKTVGEFGVDLALFFAASRNFSAFSPIAHLLLWPTIFDEEAACASTALIMAGATPDVAKPEIDDGDDDEEDSTSASTSSSKSTETKSAATSRDSTARRSLVASASEQQAKGDDGEKRHVLSHLLRKHEFVIEQLRFLREFTEVSWRAQPGTVSRLVEMISAEKRPRPFVLSFAANATFMHALLRDNLFREFFAFVDELVQNTAGYSTQMIFKAFATVGARDFAKFLKEKMVPDSKRPWETDHLQKALNAVRSSLFLFLSLFL